jgi:hypothetical protein
VRLIRQCAAQRHVSRPGLAASEARAANIWKHHTCCVIASACEKVPVSRLPCKIYFTPEPSNKAACTAAMRTPPARQAPPLPAPLPAPRARPQVPQRAAQAAGEAPPAAPQPLASLPARMPGSRLMPWPRCGTLSVRNARRCEVGARLGHHHHHKACLRDVVVRERAFILEHLATPAPPGLRHEGMGASPDRQAARARPAHLALVDDDKGPRREGGALLFFDRLLYGRDLATSRRCQSVHARKSHSRTACAGPSLPFHCLAAPGRSWPRSPS